MWEAISNILTSNNAPQTIISIIVLVLIVVIMIKSGMIKIKTKHVKIGMSEADRERTIIREQCDWARMYLKGLMKELLSKEQRARYDGYFIKYIIEIIYDEIVSWIVFNHIEDSDRYIRVKADIMVRMIYSMDINDSFRTSDYESKIYKSVEEVIKKLIDIRNIYA